MNGTSLYIFLCNALLDMSADIYKKSKGPNGPFSSLINTAI